MGESSDWDPPRDVWDLSALCSLLSAVCLSELGLKGVLLFGAHAGHTAQPNTSTAGLERENLILGYSSSGLLGSVQPVTGGVLRPERVERLQRLGRLSEDMERMLGL